ncbi:branched-chain amino acid ABC transporter permease [Acrocarpospora catenulata]|uniref:branched-chain amino acid ABC transporter permease n=1 Tax=Acrocarpospora catenulata TaxID=2836182 RepID=UPI001BD9E135|nr:branched-chain amino acid ABC transporter permease [Acrocarpospora catenulata]
MRDTVGALLEGGVSGLGYALLGASLILIVGTTGRFHFAIGVNYLLGAYAAVVVSLVAPWPLAVAAGIAAGAAGGALIEAGLYRRVERAAPASALLNIFVVAFALMSVTEAVLRLVLSSGGGVRRVDGFADAQISLFGVTLTKLNLWQAGYVGLTLVVIHLLLVLTGAGLRVRGVRSNRELATVHGMDPRRVYVLVFALGCGAVGGLGVFAALRTAATPDMGLAPAFYGFVIAFVTGLGRPFHHALVPGLAVGVTERLLLNVMSPAQTQITIFGVLFLLLVVRAALASRWFVAWSTRRAGVGDLA